MDGGWLLRRSAPEAGPAHAVVPYIVTLASIATAAVLMAPVRARLGLLNAGLGFLLLIVVVSARWGWGPGPLASLLANLAFNFFFVPPLHTLTVQEPQNVLALAAFLGVAALTSALLSRARAGEATARRRTEETSLLYELSRVIIVSASAQEALTVICRRVRETFAAEYAAVLLPSAGPIGATAWDGQAQATGYERQAAEEAYRTGVTVTLGGARGRRRPRIVGAPDRPIPAVFVPLRIAGSTIGVLHVAGTTRAGVLTDDEQRLLVAFADEAALAVDRDRLVHQAAQAQALQETDRLKSALLSAVSHDLRSPLTAILTSASSLLQEDVQWDDATRREFLTSIESQALRLSRLVSNLLDLSRIEGGALLPNREWADLHALLLDVTDGCAAALAGHTVVVEVAADMGEIFVDHLQIQQVVTNLLENAVKFSPPGTTVTLHAGLADGAPEVSVADQGPGIPPTERDHVFEKFYRMSHNDRAPGTGIGLAICKGLVEAHGGRIWVDEAPSGGARFVFRLPADAATRPQSGIAAPGARLPDGPQGSRPPVQPSLRRERARGAS